LIRHDICIHRNEFDQPFHPAIRKRGYGRLSLEAFSKFPPRVTLSQQLAMCWKLKLTGIEQNIAAENSERICVVSQDDVTIEIVRKGSKGMPIYPESSYSSGPGADHVAAS
jgi:hypothetical protein